MARRVIDTGGFDQLNGCRGGRLFRGVLIEGSLLLWARSCACPLLRGGRLCGGASRRGSLRVVSGVVTWGQRQGS